MSALWRGGGKREEKKERKRKKCCLGSRRRRGKKQRKKRKTTKTPFSVPAEFGCDPSAEPAPLAQVAPALADPAARHADPALGEVEVDVDAAVARDDDRALARVEAEDLCARALVEAAAVAPEAIDLARAAADGAKRLRGHVGAALCVL